MKRFILLAFLLLLNSAALAESNPLGFPSSGGSGGGGGVSSVSSGNVGSLATVTVTNPSTTPAFSFAMNSQTQDLIFGSPTGSNGAPVFRSITGADFGSNVLGIANGGTGQSTKAAAFDALAPGIPGKGWVIIYNSSTNHWDVLTNAGAGDDGKVLQLDSSVAGIGAKWGSAGTGTVSSFSAGNLSGIFTTSVATATTTPALTFSIANQSDKFFLGNQSGSTGPPTFQQINGASLTGQVGTANGGTGQATANAGYNALSPMTTLGDVEAEDATPKAVRVAGNTTTTKKFFNQTGNGTVSALPQWDPIATTDLPTVPLNKGGTNITSYTAGDVLVVDNSANLVKLPLGSNTQVLTIDTALNPKFKWATPSGGGGGSGTVTDFTSGNLSPLFSTSVATSTTTPALTYSLSSAAAHTFFGNETGSPASPHFVQPSFSDLAGSATSGQLPSDVAYTSSTNSFSAAQIPDAMGTRDLGSTAKAWRDLYFGTASFYQKLHSGAITANRTINTPDADSVTTIPSSAPSNQFSTGVNSSSVIQYAQPAFSNLSGTATIAQGGTGQTAKTAAFDALSPLSTLGDTPYHDGTNNVRLAGNTTTTKKFKTQTGNGTISAAPAWGTIAVGDLPTVDEAHGGTNQTSYTAGDILVANNSGNLVKLALGSNTNVLTIDTSLNPKLKWAAGGGGGGTQYNGLPGIRLTLTTNVPVTTSDVTAATTLYGTPYIHDTSYTYSSSLWAPYTFTQKSVTVPSAVFRLYDAFDDGSTTLVVTAWDSGGQTTGTITGATAASPCVLTATNSLSTGDLIGITSVTGTLGTDATKGINAKVWKVASATGSTITLEGCDTTTLSYTSGGTFYKIPTSRTTAVSYLQGHYAQASTNYLYLGTFMAGVGGVSGQAEDSIKVRGLWNMYNRLDAPILATEGTNTWTYTGTAFRPANANTTSAVGRIECVTGMSEDPVNIGNYAPWGLGNVDSCAGIGVNSNVANSADTYGAKTTGAYLSPLSRYTRPMAIGYSWVQRIEASASATSQTFLGDDGTTVIQCGLQGTVKH